MRTIDELIESSEQVLRDACVLAGGWNIEPLFSGGHDSLVATHIAAQHPRFAGRVHHIDTGIGAAYTRRFVESVCDAQGWELVVHKSNRSYEWFISRFGFPGPGFHALVYRYLKERCADKLSAKRKSKSVFVNGARSQESTRRMGHCGDIVVRDRNRKQIWTAVCHDWSKAEQQLYMDEFGLPTNKLKIAVGMSGECFCGAFAQPGEIDLIRQHAPDVAKEIDRLALIARGCGTHDQWGTRPPKDCKLNLAETGPMCSSCDQRAMASGIVLLDGSVK